MSTSFIEINVSNTEFEKRREDFIKIQIENDKENLFEVNFSKFFIQSKYIHQKYKYSEGIEQFQNELERVFQTKHIKEESIKLFFQLIEHEIASIPSNCYNDLYKLSEHFDIPYLIAELDKISEQVLFTNIDFTIQRILDSIALNDDFTKEFTSKIEAFLSTQINECIGNAKFKKLPPAIIYRVVELSNKERLNANMLVEFIIESINTRFVLLKFVKLHRLTRKNVDKLLNFIDEQDENIKKMYFEFLPIDSEYIKSILQKADGLMKDLELKNHEFSQMFNELEQRNNELEQRNNELEQRNNELEQRNNELEQRKNELEQKNFELLQMNSELEKTQNQLEQKNIDITQMSKELKKTKEELKKSIKELKEAKDELNLIKREINRKPQMAQICGYDKYYVHVEIPNNKDGSEPYIFPPMNTRIDISSLLSYSASCQHTALVMRNGSLLGAGWNDNGRISISLREKIFSKLTEFTIKGEDGKDLTPISAACLTLNTLYMLSESGKDQRQLVLCGTGTSGGQVFLDIGNKNPVAIYNGFYNAAAITDEGEVILIDPLIISNPGGWHISAYSLPEGEKAVSVACCEKSIFVLTSKGHVFSYTIDYQSNNINFSVVSELFDYEIICISGIAKHCIAVSSDGHAFGIGSNGFGQLGIDDGTGEVSSFVEILSLKEYKIRAAYAGNHHSLFETDKGKILSCGSNMFGELFLETGPSKTCFYSPVETMIYSGAKFCIAGGDFSIIFVDSEPPPYTPNMRINHIHQSDGE